MLKLQTLMSFILYPFKIFSVILTILNIFIILTFFGLYKQYHYFNQAKNNIKIGYYADKIINSVCKKDETTATLESDTVNIVNSKNCSVFVGVVNGSKTNMIISYARQNISRRLEHKFQLIANLKNNNFTETPFFIPTNPYHTICIQYKDKTQDIFEIVGAPNVTFFNTTYMCRNNHFYMFLSTNFEIQEETFKDFNKIFDKNFSIASFGDNPPFLVYIFVKLKLGLSSLLYDNKGNIRFYKHKLTSLFESNDDVMLRKED